GRDGIAKKSLEEKGESLEPLFETMIQEIPPPSFDASKPFQMLVCNLGYSDYTGRLAIGRVFHGAVKKRDELVCLQKDKRAIPLKVTKLQTYQGLSLVEADSVQAGDIVVLSGVEEVQIGDTISLKDNPESLERITVDPPTVSMRFLPNTSPFAGREGDFVQSARIYERLKKETLFNVAIQVEKDEEQEGFLVKGRGELQLAILIENMRREGFELAVGRPEVIFREENGQKLEPIEHVVIECEDIYTGTITEKLSIRKGILKNMHPFGSSRVRLEFSIPSRGLIGYRSTFLTDTKGTGIMNSYLEGYESFKGSIQSRITGSLISDRQGEAVAYGLFNLEDRGRFFIKPGDKVYEGMVIGEHSRDNDLLVNPCRTKKLTNMRAAGKDENVILTPVIPPTLEQAMEFIKEDELIEVTPKNIRLRKVLLDPHQRKAMEKKKA
ncbi:MAG: translational GTPase TypA, partial [Deltaproteobacteria bacterium]|nr:translational GTPase TypA [Deltaproteobacteria bacterium]